jgi:uncharacterized membrane protein YfcA
MVRLALLAGLAAIAAILAFRLLWIARRGPRRLSMEAVAFGFVANFFDTLGIGSFAPTTAYMKFRGLIADELIPPTLIVGYAIPTALEAFVFITNVQIDPILLVTCIALSVLGALLGASLALRLPIQQVRLFMGVGLLVAAAIFALSNLGLMPAGGTATALGARSFVTAAAVSGVLGILMNLGIGNYGPQLIALSLLGLDPRAAFPVMMGSAAFLMLTSGIKLLALRPLNPGFLISMSLGGIPAVLIAAFIVRTLPLQQLRWGVVVVVTYAAFVMLFSAVTASADPGAPFRRKSPPETFR